MSLLQKEAERVAAFPHKNCEKVFPHLEGKGREKTGVSALLATS